MSRTLLDRPLQPLSHQPWLRKHLSQEPDKKLQLVSGVVLDVLELQGKEKENGIGFWDIRRLFYFQVKFNELKSCDGVGKGWVLIARHEVMQQLPDFHASWFRGLFLVNYVAKQFLKHLCMQVDCQAEKAYDVTNKEIPNYRIKQLPDSVRSWEFITRIARYIYAHWREWEQETSSQRWVKDPFGHEYKRITRKQVGEHNLPRTITVVRQFSKEEHVGRIHDIYVHYNKRQEAIIGSGAFSELKLLYAFIKGKWKVIKQVKNDDIVHSNDMLRQEAQIQSKIFRALPLRLQGTHVKKDESERVWIIMPMARGTLAEIPLTNEWQRLSFAKEIFSQIRHLHDKGIVHCDLKPENILIDEEGKIKISDFGCAIIQQEKKFIRGTLLYCYPFRYQNDNMRDYWAAGIIFWQLLDVKLYSNTLQKNISFEEYKNLFSQYAYPVLLLLKSQLKKDKTIPLNEQPVYPIGAKVNQLHLRGELFRFLNFSPCPINTNGHLVRKLLSEEDVYEKNDSRSTSKVNLSCFQRNPEEEIASEITNLLSRVQKI